jgi:hypothetical protein
VSGTEPRLPRHGDRVEERWFAVANYCVLRPGYVSEPLYDKDGGAGNRGSILCKGKRFFSTALVPVAGPSDGSAGLFTRGGGVDLGLRLRLACVWW